MRCPSRTKRNFANAYLAPLCRYSSSHRNAVALQIFRRFARASLRIAFALLALQAVRGLHHATTFRALPAFRALPTHVVAFRSHVCVQRICSRCLASRTMPRRRHAHKQCRCSADNLSSPMPRESVRATPVLASRLRATDGHASARRLRRRPRTRSSPCNARPFRTCA